MGFSEEEKMFQNKGTQQVAHASSNAVNEPVAIYNSDGTSYVINGNILREYDASNKLVSERELSAEEKATSPSVVLKNLSNSRTSKKGEVLQAKTAPNVPEVSTEHSINNGNVDDDSTRYLTLSFEYLFDTSSVDFFTEIYPCFSENTFQFNQRVDVEFK